MYCGQSTYVKADGQAFNAKVLRCRSWKCTECAPGRRRRLIAEAIGGQPTTFITFTLKADDPRPRDQQVRALSRAWRVIRARALRRYKIKKIPFIAVVERTSRGTPHLHILSRVRYLDQQWLSRCAGELLDAPIVDIRRIDAHRGIAKYVAKYVGKEPEQFGSCKRYWQSPGYDLRPTPERDPARPRWSWQDLIKAPLSRVAHDYAGLGFIITYPRADRARFEPPSGGWVAWSLATPVEG